VTAIAAIGVAQDLLSQFSVSSELFPRIGFIVTNLNKHSKNLVKFYNGRGTAEQWIKEGKNAVKWTKLSCRTFKDNQTRLQLFALAYNLGNFLRRLACTSCSVDETGESRTFTASRRPSVRCVTHSREKS